MINHKTHIHRPMKRRWTNAEKIRNAQRGYDARMEAPKVTLSVPPWVSEEHEKQDGEAKA